VKLYLGYSCIPWFRIHAAGGGVTATLAYKLLEEYRGVVMPKSLDVMTVAKTGKDIASCQGSIYEEMKYRIPLYGRTVDTEYAQVGKPCDMDNRFGFRIALFCSGTRHRHGLQHRITNQNRPNLSRLRIPLKCVLCRDHLGREADISVGHNQDNRSENTVMVWTEKGEELLHQCVEEKLITVREVNHSFLIEQQPYLLQP